MGAWGTGSFENDDALDWATEIQAVEDAMRPLIELQTTLEEPDRETPPYLEADQAAVLVAAAETVALRLGRITSDVPEDLQKRLKDAPKPDANQVHYAQQALSVVLESSELAKLWAEESKGLNEWNQAISDLVVRLNPDTADPMLSLQKIQERSGRDIPPDCAICGKPVASEELLEMSITDYRQLAQMTLYKYVHVRCLNGMLNPKHVFQDVQYDINDLPDF